MKTKQHMIGVSINCLENVEITAEKIFNKYGYRPTNKQIVEKAVIELMNEE